MCCFVDVLTNQPCQFQNLPDHATPKGGYCEHHLPLAGEGSKESWSPEERRDYCNRLMRLVGNTHHEIDLTGIQVPISPLTTAITFDFHASVSHISLRGAEIRTAIDFGRTVWPALDARRAIFGAQIAADTFRIRGGCLFDEAEFQHGVSISQLMVAGFASFKLAVFRGAFIVGNAQLGARGMKAPEGNSPGHIFSDTRIGGELRINCDVYGPGINFDRLAALSTEHRAQLHLNCQGASISMQDAEFKGGCNITGAFNGTEFTARSLQVLGDLEITGEWFVPATFRGAKIVGRVVIHDCTFTRQVIFDDCDVSKSLDVSKVVFKAAVSFAQGRYGTRARFSECNFQGIDLSDCSFKGPLEITGSDIFGLGLLKNMKCDGLVIFDRSREPGRGVDMLDFSGSRFVRLVFRSVVFHGGLDFNGCTFARAPAFWRCEFHPDTKFPPISHFLDTESPSAAEAYQELRQQMERLRSRGQEGMFFTLEQRSRRRSNRMGWLDRAVSWIYDVAAEYGLSYVRPVVWGIIGWIIFAVIYALIETPFIDPRADINRDLMFDAFEFSAQQIFSPLSVWRLNPHGVSTIEINGWVRLVASIESLIVGVLATFTVLALRWRFRRA